MTLNEFIFSPKWRPRLLRHVVFWVCRILFLTLAYSFIWRNTKDNLIHHMAYFLVRCFGIVVVSEIGLCYVVNYFIIPAYFDKNKYFSFAALIFSAVIFFYIMMLVWFFTVWYPDALHKHSLTFHLTFHWGFSKSYFTFGGPAVCILFVCIKMFKNLYLKEKEKQLLLKENMDAEMQLLKAQIHPHFLFNTLNNIYSFTLNNSSKASMLVLKLSAMMNYIISDCEKTEVDLDKELQLLSDYIELERVRYGNQLEVEINISGTSSDKKIAPLLMIPFVENAFKHGTSKMLEQPWLKMQIEIQEYLLNFQLQNSVPDNIIQNQKKGIGLDNVKKRLQLLYPEKYKLNIRTETGFFSVGMQIPVHYDHSP